jgi:hypothetical protein
LKDDIRDTFVSSLIINLHEMHFKKENIPFSFAKKQGFPKMRDHGLLDFETIGNGISMQVKIDYFPSDPSKTLKVRNVCVAVDKKIKIKVSHSRHDGLYRSLGALKSAFVKRHLVQILKDNVYKLVTALNDFLTAQKIHQAKIQYATDMDALLVHSGLIKPDAMKTGEKKGVDQPARGLPRKGGTGTSDVSEPWMIHAPWESLVL